MLPSASTGWFDDLGQEVEQAQARSLPGGGESAHNERDRQTLLEGYAYLERVRAPVRVKPHNRLGVTPRWRAQAGPVLPPLQRGKWPSVARSMGVCPTAG